VSLSATEVALVCGELAPVLAGRRVQKVHQPDPQTLLLDLGGKWLLLSVHRRAARIHALSGKPAAPEQPTAFAMLLRKELGNARLVELAASENDRIATLRFSNGRLLIAELFGDLVLTDEEGRVLGALRRKRGEPYVPPALSTAKPKVPRFVGSADIAAHYDAILSDIERAEAERRRAAERKRLERLIANLEADLARADDAEGMRRNADLLLAHLAEVPRGAAEVVLPDDFTDGSPLRIALDPALGAQANAEKLYKRSRKLAGARAQIAQRLAEARSRLEADAIATPQKRLRGQREREAPRLPYKEFLSETGDTIWVGRSARDNDSLTFQHARGADWWLHVRDSSGSHVVVRARPGRQLDDRTLRDAAALAAHFSGLRDEPQVDVQYTLCKHVRKARAPGAVYVSDAKTIRVRRDETRLSRLLSTPRNS
jgi:predicted ribosome quality control (RQC) complex YloA/Tae2 family protein